MRRGEVWWGEIEDLGRRPFLIMTRPSAIPVLNHLVAAPVTRTIRGIPTELRLGPDDGMPAECAASFDNIRVVPKALPLSSVSAPSARTASPKPAPRCEPPWPAN